MSRTRLWESYTAADSCRSAKAMRHLSLVKCHASLVKCLASLVEPSSNILSLVTNGNGVKLEATDGDTL